jgi:hypothetical protein
MNGHNDLIVIWRSGGWANAEWRVTLETHKTRKEAQAFAGYIERMGYRTMIKSGRELRAIGLPVGFCVHADPITGRMEAKTCTCP